MTAANRIARLRIELDDTDPLIWRRVEVPLGITLKGLHDVIQAVMPFEDRHLFHFEFGDTRYGIPDPEWDHFRDTLDAKEFTLGAVLDGGTERFIYTYDFGDDWRHTLRVEAVSEADLTLDYPRFVEGERRAPPEDVGGIPGFETFLDAMSNPDHPERERLLEWHGGPFRPDEPDRPVITGRIGKLARHQDDTGVRASARRRKATH